MTSVKENIFDLTGQVAFVTGAGQGVGRGIARLLAAHNASIAVNDYFLDRAEAVAQELRAEGAKAFAVQADVGDLAAVEGAFASVRAELGEVSILVNNAGNAGPDGYGAHKSYFWETGPSDWDKYFRVNLFGVLNCCKAAAPAMVQSEYGRIITVVSDAGRVGEPKMADYAAAKAGAAGFMRGLAKDLGRFNVTANCISISSIEPKVSEEAREQLLKSERVQRQLARYVIRRYGQPEDVAAMALFLASGAAGWITGQTYPVNGGYSFAT